MCEVTCLVIDLKQIEFMPHVIIYPNVFFVVLCDYYVQNDINIID